MSDAPIPIDSELLREILVTMRHARVFIGSREKMHPDGQALFNELADRVEELWRDGRAQKPITLGCSDTAEGPIDG